MKEEFTKFEKAKIEKERIEKKLEIKIIDSWFTSSFKEELRIGYVCIETKSGVRKIYAGSFIGDDINKDVERIITWGSPHRSTLFIQMFNRLQGGKSYE